MNGYRQGHRSWLKVAGVVFLVVVVAILVGTIVWVWWASQTSHRPTSVLSPGAPSNAATSTQPLPPTARHGTQHTAVPTTPSSAAETDYHGRHFSAKVPVAWGSSQYADSVWFAVDADNHTQVEVVWAPVRGDESTVLQRAYDSNEKRRLEYDKTGQRAIALPGGRVAPVWLYNFTGKGNGLRLQAETCVVASTGSYLAMTVWSDNPTKLQAVEPAYDRLITTLQRH